VPHRLSRRRVADSVISVYQAVVTVTFPPTACVLRTLDLSSNLLTGTIPPSLGNVTTLTSLSLGRNKLVGDLPLALFDLSNLELLDLSWPSSAVTTLVLTGTLPSTISNLNKLT
jgi:hypothetical protein